MNQIGVIKEWIGTSAEVKPTDADAGDKFYETDTQLRFVYTGTAWVLDKRKEEVEG